MPFTPQSKAPVSADFPTRVVTGDVAGWTAIRKFGSADSIGTSQVVVASAKTYQTPTTAQALEILSSDANDTSAGTGARTVTVQGLGSDWTETSETVTMNGTSAVALSTSFTRVFRMFVAGSGTYASSAASSHAGTITLRASGGGDTWAAIGLIGGIGVGQTEIGAYTVPAGKRAIVLGRKITVETNKSVNVEFFRREGVDTVSAPYSPMRILEVNRGLTGDLEGTYSVTLGPFTGPCDIGFFAAATTGTASVEVSFSLLLEDV